VHFWLQVLTENYKRNKGQIGGWWHSCDHQKFLFI
jgi:hypothetical protein